MFEKIVVGLMAALAPSTVMAGTGQNRDDTMNTVLAYQNNLKMNLYAWNVVNHVDYTEWEWELHGKLEAIFNKTDGADYEIGLCAKLTNQDDFEQDVTSWDCLQAKFNQGSSGGFSLTDHIVTPGELTYSGDYPLDDPVGAIEVNEDGEEVEITLPSQDWKTNIDGLSLVCDESGKYNDIHF